MPPELNELPRRKQRGIVTDLHFIHRRKRRGIQPEGIKKQGITIGKLYTHDNGTLQMRDVEDNYTIGWYYPKIDKTYGHGNKPVGRGNLLLNLLNERLRKGD